VTPDAVYNREAMAEFMFSRNFPEFVALRDEISFQEKLHSTLSKLESHLQDFEAIKHTGKTFLELEGQLEEVTFPLSTLRVF
jgi:hypothetical protein